MNRKMQNQDQIKFRNDLNSNKGIESIRKTPIKSFDSFTPSPLKKESFIPEQFKSGSIVALSQLVPVKEQAQFAFDSELDDENNNENLLANKNNDYKTKDFMENNNDSTNKSSNISKLISADALNLVNEQLDFILNLQANSNSSGNFKNENKEKYFDYENINLSNKDNLNSNSNSNNNNNNITKSYTTTNFANLANLNTISQNNIYNNSIKIKEKEIREEGNPLTSNLKNFLENYDDLLGMIGSNSKSSTMTSNFSNENNTNMINKNYAFSSLLDKESLIKTDPKSKTTKLPHGTSLQNNNINSSLFDENAKNDKKFKFSTSFKTTENALIKSNNIKNRKSTGECFQPCSISLKKAISNMAVPQSKTRSKELESGLVLKLNCILEENKAKENFNNFKSKSSKYENSKCNESHHLSGKNNQDERYSIVPKFDQNEELSSDNFNENENDCDSEYEGVMVSSGSNFKLESKAKKAIFKDSEKKDESNKNSKDSFITLNPIKANANNNNNNNTNNIHLDTLVTSQVRKPTIQLNQVEDRNLEETKIVQNLTNQEDIKDFYEYTEECLKRIIKLEIPNMDEIKELLFDLPFEEDLKTKKLAIFDLDETLIHCEIKKPQKGQVQIMVNLPSGDKAKIGLNIRPFWKECLQELSKYYLIIVYTASHQSYADSVLDYLDPNKELIKHRLYRHNCVRVKMENEFIYVKDLRIFKNVKMEQMIIIDNSVLSFAFQLENGIPILPFYDNPEDIELKFLTNYLSNIYTVKDLRVENNRSIKMLYFLNAVKEKEKSESNDFNFNLINLKNENNENNNNDDSNSLVTDPEGNSGSKGKQEQNISANNSNSLFKISLFSTEANDANKNIHKISNKDNLYNFNNQNENSQISENNEVSFSNSESSHNNSGLALGVNVDNNVYNNITNRFFGGSKLSTEKNIDVNNINNSHSKNYVINNLNMPSNSNSSGKRVKNKRNNTFQDNLFSTLDDLKKTFSILSEKKRNSVIFNNNSNN